MGRHLTDEQRRAQREARLRQAHDLYAQSIESLRSSERWLTMLKVSARFHRYSPRNQILIMFQMPEATRVAGYQTWRSLGRQVRRGETGIAVLAPVSYKHEPTEEDPTDSLRLRGFKIETVFDVSQTDGEPLPEPIKPELLTGNAPAKIWDGLCEQARVLGWEVVRESPHTPGANGECDPTDHKVRIEPMNPPLQQLKTLLHEVAGHIRLGHTDNYIAYRSHRGQYECEAEGVAYIVADALELDTAAYSVAYGAHWLQGRDIDTIRETSERVIQAARVTLDDLGMNQESERETAPVLAITRGI